MVDPATVSIGVLAVLVLLAASAFFSSTEIAIFSLPEGALLASEEAGRTAPGDDRVRTLAVLRGDPHRLLVTLLVGNNVVNVALSAVVTVGMANLLPPGQAVVASTLVASTVVLVFGEILPKSYGLGHAEQWALSSARPLTVIQAALYPVVAVFDLLTRRLGTLVGGSQHIERPYTE